MATNPGPANAGAGGGAQPPVARKHLSSNSAEERFDMLYEVPSR